MKAKIDLQEKPLEWLKPAEYNPRKELQPGDPEYEALKRSIQANSYVDPIITNADGTVIGGHQRLNVLKDLGYTHADVVVVDKNKDEEKVLNIALNNISGEWDEAKLAELIGEIDISGIDATLTGFDYDEIKEMVGTIDLENEAVDDGYEPEIPEEPIAQSGQIWVLGNHRLMCGDSSSEEDMRNLMGGVEADMVFTDPPYGVAIGDKNKMLDSFSKAGRITKNIEGDTLSTDELYDLLLAAFRNLKANCKEDCSYYVSSPQGGEIGLMMMMMRDAGLEVRHNLIWEKSSATFSMGRLDYDYKHEPIFYTWTKKHNFYGKGKCKNTVWQFPKPRKSDLHPTMKPVELVAECILNSSKKGDIVADIFGGSGTTLIACEQLGRSCRMMEKDPHYVDVIIDRWQQYTGRKAELLNG